MVGSAALHLALSHAFWYELLRDKRVIDGGPLGFLTWTIPTLVGSLAYDVVREAGSARIGSPTDSMGRGARLCSGMRFPV